MDVRFSNHALERMEQRKISREYVIDTLSNYSRRVAKSRGLALHIEYTCKENELVVATAAELERNFFLVVTVFRISQKNKKNRIVKKRNEEKQYWTNLMRGKKKRLKKRG